MLSLMNTLIVGFNDLAVNAVCEPLSTRLSLVRTEPITHPA